ncbi:triple tyrosine motif-containing protein [uncultured Clostridium sp.]|uniref:triple tyrosine motif-containing protein n=1 Tax=uncultured Clostridium sp. TaxID=59620 RepID=UPI0025E9E4E7|nr:triple tyrosine motif-containing protein [uncultured Clostridium sp.]
MNEIQSKFIEIVFDKEKPQSIDTSIRIIVKADNIKEELEYKFLIGKGGIWSVIKDFSKSNQCLWVPKEEGNYIIMVQAREKSKARPLDYLAKEEFSIVKGEIIQPMNEDFKDSNPKNKYDNNDSCEKNLENFKELISETNDNVLFLKASQVSSEEKKVLMKGIDKTMDEIAVTQDVIDEKEKANLRENEDISESSKQFDEEEDSLTNKSVDTSNAEDTMDNHDEIIDEVIIEKDHIFVAEKVNIRINTIEKETYLYKFYVKNKNEWSVIKEYDTDNNLIYTATKAGHMEILVQCKRLNSNENFDDFRIVDIDVAENEDIEIVDVKCLTKELIAGKELEFTVDTNVKKNCGQVILYKFFKISKEGKSTCIQDYSTNNGVKFIEEQAGTYRILCLVRSILSNKEYNDRAVLLYNVKPYKDIEIKSFVADLNSPQATETEITFGSDVVGGNDLLYRYKVRGPIEEDTGFIINKQFTWMPNEPGEYEIVLYVKDKTYTEEYEDKRKIAFTIEKRGKRPIKILDVVVDKEKKIIIGDTVNIMVNAEGGTGLLYSFIIKKDSRVVTESKYSTSNWIDFIPGKTGEYEVEIRVKDKYSEKEFDIHNLIYLKAMEYIPGEIDYILLPYKENYLIGDTIEFECIVQNTNETLVKYETKINGQSIEQTEFAKNKKLRFVPKTPGKYTIEVYAKNIKCDKEFDSKKQINLYVNEASPVLNTKIISNKPEGKVNEEFAIEVTSRGGKDVCYEFYLMENCEWKKVQSYSKKNFYSFIPFESGKYKILALAKSYYKKVSYEDYSELTFIVKD